MKACAINCLSHLYLAIILLAGTIIPITGHALEAVPGWSDDPALPAAATWPALRHLGTPLRIQVISDTEAGINAYQRIARRLHATLDTYYLLQGFDHFHVHDSWIEPKGSPTEKEAFDKSWELALSSLNLQDGKPPTDVLFLSGLGERMNDTMFITRVKAYAEAGGVVVFCGNTYPNADNPLFPLWPAQPAKNNNWMQSGSKVEHGALLAGVPAEFLTAHTWIPFMELTPGSLWLASGQAGSAAIRPVGKGVFVLSPTGPFSRRYNALNTIVHEYDHDEIWLRYWDTLLYQLVRSSAALPAFAHLQSQLEAAAPGQPYELKASITNKTMREPMQLTLHLTSPRGKVLHSEQQTLKILPGETITPTFTIPVAASWAAGRYPVYLTLADPAKKLQLHQALEFLPVQGQVSLKLVAAQKGYRLGETAQLTLSASSPQPWSGRLALGVFDFRGRLLHSESREVTLTAETAQIPFNFTLVDAGVTVDAYRVQLAALKDTVEWGRTETTVYNYQPWSMRNEYQWSTWARMATTSSSQIPRAMSLMDHAGMNAFGFPQGGSDLNYAAERWGWRYYNEGVGMNTFSPVIEYENVAEIEAAGLKQAASKFNDPVMNSAAFILGSVGEEAGFKDGWGKRYYWDTPVAPEKACRAFQWYLRTRYPDITSLNLAWGTKFADFTGVQLTREFSGSNPALDADGWATPRELAPEAGVEKVTPAPYKDTADFYNWYYDQIIDVARKILREKINPRTLAFSSAPTIGNSYYDVRGSGPSGWNGYQSSMTSYGEEPGFGMTWGHFDWNVKTESIFWDYLMTRSGHNNYWVDQTLMFNRDMSHTRASFAMRKWTRNFAGHERIILDSRPMATEVGILGINGAQLNRSILNMENSLKVAATQAGYGFEPVKWEVLSRYKIIYAVGLRSLSQQQAAQLDGFVKNGGTLVFTPQFALENEVGVPQPVTPAHGLAAEWQLTVTKRAQTLPENYREQRLPVALNGVDPALAGKQLTGEDLYRETVDAPGWATRANYPDGLPALLDKVHGKGRLVFLNAVYYSHYYIQFVTATDANRQGFYSLVENLCAQSGARRDLRLEGSLEQMLHLSLKQFCDPSGEIQYLVLNSYGEAPYVAGGLHWLGQHRAAYDVLAVEPGKRAPLYENLPGNAPGQLKPPSVTIPLQLRPGAGKLLAFLREPVAVVALSATPARFIAGETLTLTMNITAAGGKPVPGSFPWTLRVSAPDGKEITGLTRSFSAAHGEKYTLATALNDPAGRWTLTLTDGITGISASTTVNVQQSPLAADAPAFESLAWSSENWEPVRVTEEDFLQRLQELADLYQRDYSGADWMAKQYLGYYYDNYPGTRHTLLRPLNEIDWTAFVPALQRALTAGETIILTGEDVNVDPGSGLATWPHGDGKQLMALAQVLAKAKTLEVSADGAILRATLGKGKLLLCRESIDAAGHRSSDTRRWQIAFLKRIAAVDGWQRITVPNEALLREWWSGLKPLGKPSTLITLVDGEKTAMTTVNPGASAGAVLVFALPTAAKTSPALKCTLNWVGDGVLHYDVGCDNVIDGDVANALPLDLNAAVAGYLAKWTPERDGNRRMLIPVRFTAEVKTDLSLIIN